MTTNNTYRIYIRSNEHPRTINTPMRGRTYYTLVECEGKEAFTSKLNELVNEGHTVLDVRKGFGGARVDWTAFIKQ